MNIHGARRAGRHRHKACMGWSWAAVYGGRGTLRGFPHNLLKLQNKHLDTKRERKYENPAYINAWSLHITHSLLLTQCVSQHFTLTVCFLQSILALRQLHNQTTQAKLGDTGRKQIISSPELFLNSCTAISFFHFSISVVSFVYCISHLSHSL